MKTLTINPRSTRAQFSSDLVRSGDWAITSAIGPVDLDNDRTALPEGVEAQVRKIFANLDRILLEAGLAKENIVAVRVYLVEGQRLLQRMNAAYAGYFPADRLPARSVIGATYLTRGAQVEMEFTLSARNDA